MNEELKGKIIADLGCGNGVLGIGCLLLGARKVYFLDKDKESLKIAKKNYKGLFEKGGVFVNKEVEDFNKKVDLVIQNPPFGVQRKGADRVFLDTAMRASGKIYSFHKSESEDFLRKYCKGFGVEKIKDFNFVLKKTMRFHKKEKHFAKVGVFRIFRM